MGKENGQNVIPRAPEPLVVPKTERKIVEDRTREFFGEIRQAVGESEDVEVQAYDVERFGRINSRIIKDRITALQTKDDKNLLASVLERTDTPDPKHVTVSYALYLDEKRNREK